MLIYDVCDTLAKVVEITNKYNLQFNEVDEIELVDYSQAEDYKPIPMTVWPSVKPDVEPRYHGFVMPLSTDETQTYGAQRGYLQAVITIRTRVVDIQDNIKDVLSFIDNLDQNSIYQRYFRYLAHGPYYQHRTSLANNLDEAKLEDDTELFNKFRAINWKIQETGHGVDADPNNTPFMQATTVLVINRNIPDGINEDGSLQDTEFNNIFR